MRIIVTSNELETIMLNEKTTVIKKVTLTGKTIIEVKYGLQYLKGNDQSYFFIGGTEYHANSNGEKDKRYKECITSGAIGDRIVKRDKKFADMNKMHLRDFDGTPMHPIENGLYWLGCTEYEDFNLEQVCDHFMIDEKEAYRLRDIIHAENDRDKQREILRDIIEKSYKKVWQEKATEIIKKYGLDE